MKEPMELFGEWLERNGYEEIEDLERVVREYVNDVQGEAQTLSLEWED